MSGQAELSCLIKLSKFTEENQYTQFAVYITVLYITVLYCVAGSGTPRATPYMAHHKRVNTEVAAEEEGGDKKQSQQPRGINRLSSG